MAIVEFLTSLGGDGSKVSDDNDPVTGLGNGGHRTRFVPALKQMVAIAGLLVNTATNLASKASQVALDATNAALSALTTLVGTKADASATSSSISTINSNLALKAPLASPALTGNPTAPTQASTDNSTRIATTAFVRSASKSPGEIFTHAGSTAPAGSLICPTSQTNISRTTYAALFAAIGTTWGAGDGSTTFGMPWFPADYTLGQANGNVGTITSGSIPQHAHLAPIGSGSGGGATASLFGTNLSSTSTLATSSAGSGVDNLAAGVRVLHCVQYLG